MTVVTKDGASAAELRRQGVKKQGLSHNRKLFVKELIDNPKITPSEAARRSHNLVSARSAAAVANRNMKDPKVLMALGKHSELFESVIVGTARDWSKSDMPRKREIALNAAMFGHDKVHGKATVKVEQQVSVVKIAIDLSGGDLIEEEPIDLPSV